MISEFKEFAMRGNVIDMAVGVILGTAFGKIVTSLVDDILMPPIGMLLGKVNFTNIFINLSHVNRWHETLEEAKAAGDATINLGLFINSVIDFVIIAFAVFLMVRQMNRIRQKQEKVSGSSDVSDQDQVVSDHDHMSLKVCRFCLSSIPAGATKCKHCTAQLEVKINYK